MKRFLIALAVMAAVTGCKSSTGAGKGNALETFTISGPVKLNSASGTAISGATVFLESAAPDITSRTVMTNSSGVFFIGNIESGSYTVMVSKPGYTFDSAVQTITVADRNVTTEPFTGIFTGTTDGTAHEDHHR